jgi:hypothetical protein
MFRPNKRHVQPALISNVNDLPEKQRRRLEESWAGTFRGEFFSRLKEEAFAVLYSDLPSRPNVPVNVLVSLDTLKAGYGWSDEELYDHFSYDLQVRYAVGYESLSEGDFELRTLYNFRRRLSQYNLEHGTNLLATAFAEITDQQITTLAVRSGQQRMDSTQIASNIMLMSRLQLAVEAVQRLARLLSAEDQERYGALLAPYVGERASHYVHRMKGIPAKEAQLQPVGEVLSLLLQAMAPDYGQEPAYQVVARLFAEQFRAVGEGVEIKADRELTAASLQSLDDVEATYRAKNGVGYRGYVTSVSETCDPANGVQLITDVQVASNNTQDSALLKAALPDLKRRTGLDTLYTDGAFGSPENDVVLQAQQVTLLQTGILGKQPTADRLHLADFVITQDAAGFPLEATCPQGQTTPVTSGRRPGRFSARFDPQVCCGCPLGQAKRCPPQPDPRRCPTGLAFGLADLAKSQRHRRSRALRQGSRNPRAAIEATVRSLKYPFPAGKLPVRGLFRVTCLLIASAAMTNVRRIQRHLSITRSRPPVGAPERVRQGQQATGAATIAPASTPAGLYQSPVTPSPTPRLVAFRTWLMPSARLLAGLSLQG